MGQSKGEMFALAIVLSILATVAVVLRFRARRMLKLQFQWDDYMILPALLFTIVTGVLMIIGAAAGSLGQHTQVGPEGPISDRRLVVFQQTLFANQLSQLLAVGPTKLSVLLFYRRIFKGRLFNIISWCLIAVVISWTIAFFFGNLLECIPISINWTGSGMTDACVDEVPLYLAQAYSDVATDVLILALPIPLIWGLHLPTNRKIALTGVFFLGALTVAASVAKLVIQYFVGTDLEANPDLSYYLTPIVYWPMIEASLGIVAACLPTLRPMFATWSVDSVLDRLRSGISLPSKRSSRSRSGYAMNQDNDANSESSAIGFKQRAHYTSGMAKNTDGERQTNIESVPMSSFEMGAKAPDGMILVRKDFRTDDDVYFKV